MSYPRKTTLYVCGLSLLACVILLFCTSDWIGRILYPIHYKEDIKASAALYQVDPLLVAAIIRVESNYKPDKVSVKDAKGLMQILPSTAHWLIEMNGQKPIEDHRLLEQSVNIEVGTLYLSVLARQFHDTIEQMTSESKVAFIAAAYNAGPGNVSKWYEQGLWDGNPRELSGIPFGETRHYVRRVLYYYDKYDNFYDEEFARP